MDLFRGSILKSSAVLISCFGLYFITFGMVKSFGVMYSELRRSFSSSASDTSWIASLSTGLMYSFAPVGGIFERRFGCRVVAICGCLLITVGMISSAFVPSIYWLFLTYGIISGLGFSLGFLVANVAVNIHFQYRRSIAVAIATAGSAIGNIFFPWFITFCIGRYGWRGTFLLLAAVALQGVVCGAVLSNVSTSKVPSKQPSKQISLKEDINQILRKKAFIWLTLSGTCSRMVLFVPYVMTPEVAVLKGISLKDVATVFLVIGVSGIIGRVLVSFLIDIAHVNRKWVYSVNLFIGGVSTIGYAYFEKTWLFILYGVFFGLFTGTFGFLQSIVTVDIVGKRSAGVGLGFLNMFNGVSVIIGPPIAGWIADATNTFTYTFLYTGGMFCLASFFAAMIQIPHHYKKVNKDSTDLPDIVIPDTDKKTSIK